MITGAIGLLLFVIGVILALEGQWGPAAVAGVLAIVVISMGSASRERDRAYGNFIRFWSDGGASERRRAEQERKRQAEQARLEREKRQAKVDKRVNKLIAERQAANAASGQQEILITTRCEACGKDAREIRRVKYPSGAEYAEYKCPHCGTRRLKKI